MDENIQNIAKVDLEKYEAFDIIRNYASYFYQFLYLFENSREYFDHKIKEFTNFSREKDKNGEYKITKE